MTDVEELLKDGIDRLTAGAGVPAGMADRVRRRLHRRQVAARTTAAAGAAAAGAVAVFAAAAPGGPTRSQHPPASVAGGHHPPSGATAPARTVADVIGRAEHAVSTGDLIMEYTSNAQVWSVAGPPGHHRFTHWRAVGWSYRNRQLGDLFSGPPGFGEGRPVQYVIATRLGTGRPGTTTQATITRVDYRDHTWSRAVQRVTNPGAPVKLSCALRQYLSRPMAPLKTDLAASPASIRAALGCGGLAITGRGQVDGVSVIKLASTSRLTKYRLTVDVSPVTYLPVRLRFGDLRFDYRWLQPTPVNLAKLTVHIPPNFHRVTAK